MDAHEKIETHIFCSGHVFSGLLFMSWTARYTFVLSDILQERREKGWKHATITRVEQIAPFPFQQVAEVTKRFPYAKLIWCQEEPQNQGAYNYVRPRFETALLKFTKRKGTDATVVRILAMPTHCPQLFPLSYNYFLARNMSVARQPPQQQQDVM